MRSFLELVNRYFIIAVKSENGKLTALLQRSENTVYNRTSNRYPYRIK